MGVALRKAASHLTDRSNKVAMVQSARAPFGRERIPIGKLIWNEPKPGWLR